MFTLVPWMVFILLLISSVIADLLVHIHSGKIQGYERLTPNNRKFHAFQGIPYAKPPLGKLRFQAPLEVDHWSGVLETKKDGDRCYSQNKDTADENEDCLFINVYTPVLDTKNSTLVPVMVYLYGGGFRDGASKYDVYGPDYLLEEDVIMVSLNYRVGPFGFLSTGDMVVPGNSGLKDQVLALKWVKKNIKLFGGDPKKVTIFGQSAGAASVGFHILSKTSTGLFRAALAESGSAVSCWAYLADPEPYGYELASRINSSVILKTNSELLQYLQSVPAKQIDIGSTKTTKINHPLPVLEVKHPGAFLTHGMYELLKRGQFNKVPLFMGSDSEEYLSKAEDLDALHKNAESYEKNVNKLVPTSMNINDTGEKQIVGMKIKELYVKDGGPMQDNLGPTLSFQSESHFFNPCVRHAQLQSKYTDVYFYKFSYAGPLGNNLNITLPGAEKCTHGEEMYYFFKRSSGAYDNSDLSKFSAADVLTHKRVVKLWTNFAKHMNPTPEKTELLQNIIWPKMKPNEIHYVDINTNLEIKTDIKEGRYLQWRKLFDEYAVPPIVTF